MARSTLAGPASALNRAKRRAVTISTGAGYAPNASRFHIVATEEREPGSRDDSPRRSSILEMGPEDARRVANMLGRYVAKPGDSTRVPVAAPLDALDAIAAALDGKEWDSDTADVVARIVRETGRKVRSPEDV